MRGKTTSQIANAPINAIYVWCNGDLWYPRHLAHELKREDLRIISPRMVTDQQLRGRKFSDIIVDHAAVLDPMQIDFIQGLNRIGENNA